MNEQHESAPAPILLIALLQMMQMAQAASARHRLLATMGVWLQQCEPAVLQPAPPVSRHTRSELWWLVTVPRMSPDMFHSNFRMSRMHFDTLIELLSGHGGLEYQPNLRRFDSRKAVAMMLARLSTTATCREVGNMSTPRSMSGLSQ